uniref:NADH dehydrogenase subunit 2 n=1 Tax=Echinochasmus japonicus TaxID=1197313 RepID=A0A186QDL1_9TREM|nr:NADH dehydrogenase subunit 2 [Echinochasmus japonicus]AKL39061.1 NADH dehydrogenase subunit 2 [Echinochasmus japonicus]
MRGLFIGLLSLGGLISFCFLMFVSDSVSLFWLFLELCTLSLIPSFFMANEYISLVGLFNYIIVSSISSSLILCGILCEGLLFMLIVGLLVKFGLFPFLGWVYSVCLNSNWFVVWGVSTFLKFPLFFLPFFLSFGGLESVFVVSCVTLVLLSVLFWVYSYSWYGCWCHMMLSSSACLVASSLVVSSELILYLFLVYCVWCSLVILFLALYGFDGQMGVSSGGVGYYLFFCLLLLSFPFSFSVFYKLLLSVVMFSCGLAVMVCWVLYSISEQFYLLKYLMSCSVPKSLFGVVSVV